jgi:hypothetical protein
MKEESEDAAPSSKIYEMKHFCVSTSTEKAVIKLMYVWPTNTNGFGVTGTPNNGGIELSPAHAILEQKV